MHSDCHNQREKRGCDTLFTRDVKKCLMEALKENGQKLETRDSADIKKKNELEKCLLDKMIS